MKKMILIEHAGHFPLVTHAAEFVAALDKYVRPLAAKATDRAKIGAVRFRVLIPLCRRKCGSRSTQELWELLDAGQITGVPDRGPTLDAAGPVGAGMLLNASRILGQTG